MNRDFVYNFNGSERSGWSRAGSTIHRLLWRALCCGVPGIPCHFCTCCEKVGEPREEWIRPGANHDTIAVERIPRLHRPHAPGCRKSTPEMMSAVRSALLQLQGEPGPPASPEAKREPNTQLQPG